MSAFKAPLDPSTSLGGFSGNNYSEASAFAITYPVNNAVDETGTENGMAVAWEKAFIQLAKDELLPMVLSSNLTLSFSSESSIEEELKRESTADITTIAVSYLVMFVYISMTLGDTPHFASFYLSSKVLIGLSGVMVVMLSVLGSVGFFSAIGIKSTLIIMEVIPFLVLAVGVDNMCILVHAMKRQSLELPLEERLSNALVEVGPCCSPDEGSCYLGKVCKDCTTCFRHSDLESGRPSTVQFREKLPWFLTALPSADCAKGGHGAYTSSVDLKGYESGVIRASEFRTYHTPQNKKALERVLVL